MDGTGILFEAILSELRGMDLLILSLPQEGPQDYQSLSTQVTNTLPDEDFILLAESFSGGIAAILSGNELPNMKGIIFVASFLSAPKKLFTYLTSYLPIKFLSQLPLSSIVHRTLFLGHGAEGKEIKRLRRALKAVPGRVLKSRLRIVAKYHYSGFKSLLPAVYIGASNDKLVPKEMKREFIEAYPKLRFIELQGPHFILQAQPKSGASAIISAVHIIID
jgi:pimeloyl-ACP methyl ester carboxylesterase